MLLDLTYSNEPKVTCPNLTHLKLIGLPATDTVISLIQSRINPPDGCLALRYLDLQSMKLKPPLLESFVDTIKGFENRGLCSGLGKPLT